VTGPTMGPVITPGSPIDKFLKAGGVSSTAYALIAIMLLVIIASTVDAKLAGGLIVVVVMGMVYAAHKKQLI